MHLDVKKLGRFRQTGHRITGDQRKQSSCRGERDGKKWGSGWEYVHVAIDDHSRIAFVEVYPNERAVSTVAHLLECSHLYYLNMTAFKGVGSGWSAPLRRGKLQVLQQLKGTTMTKMRNCPRPAHVFGVDISKTLFRVVGLDREGGVLQKAKFRRQTLLQFFERAEPTIVGMEACPGSQWLARKLIVLGHDVRIVPAKFVKPYVKSNKSDLIDAEAIAEAVSRPTMRFVEVKTEEQVDGQALHRIRQQLVSQRTRLICQMRAFCLEYGVALRPGVGCFKIDLPATIKNENNDLSQTMRRLLNDLFCDLDVLERRIAQVTAEIEAAASRDERIQRLMTIPGVGPLGASALVAAVGDAKQFRKTRDMSSWLGIVPRQMTTGGKPTLLGISKRGNSYLRKLIIHGARSCLMHLDRSRDRLGAWLNELEKRMHRNKVAVALANKLVRIAWVILTKPGTFYTRTDPRFA